MYPDTYVFDGVSLLNCLTWQNGNTYNAIAVFYADFTMRHYEQSKVLFNGYEKGPSIKDYSDEEKVKHIVILPIKGNARAKRMSFCILTKTRQACLL